MLELILDNEEQVKKVKLEGGVFMNFGSHEKQYCLLLYHGKVYLKKDEHTYKECSAWEI